MSLPPQVRIFREIHDSLYLKSERRLSPASFSPSRRDSQRGRRGGGESSGGRSSVPLYVSPLMFNPVSHTGFDPGPTYQHLPLGPLRPSSTSAHCDIHSYAASHSGETRPVFYKLLPRFPHSHPWPSEDARGDARKRGNAISDGADSRSQLDQLRLSEDLS